MDIDNIIEEIVFKANNENTPTEMSQVTKWLIVAARLISIECERQRLTIEYLQRIADPKHSETRHTVDGLRRIARIGIEVLRKEQKTQTAEDE